MRGVEYVHAGASSLGKIKISDLPGGKPTVSREGETRPGLITKSGSPEGSRRRYQAADEETISSAAPHPRKIPHHLRRGRVDFNANSGYLDVLEDTVDGRSRRRSRSWTENYSN